MNIHPTYALTSRPDTNRLLRWWTALARTALFGGIFLADVAVNPGDGQPDRRRLSPGDLW
jgi:hypothetical protein